MSLILPTFFFGQPLKPVNAPILLWFESMPLLKIVVVMGIAAIFMVASDRKIRTARICAHEIYGSGRKAAIYQLGGWVTLLALFYLSATHYHH